MNLLKIRPKNNSLYYIELDEQIRGTLNFRALRKLHLKKELEIEIEQDFADAIEKEILSLAWHRLLNWLSYHEKSIAQSRKYLLFLHLAENLAETLIDKAVKLNYINNERFARLLIESLIDKNKSWAEIKSKLYEYQIPSEMTSTLLQELYDQDVQSKVLNDLVDHLCHRWNFEDIKKKEKKVCEYLARRGFDYYEAKNTFYRINNATENYDQYSD